MRNPMKLFIVLVLFFMLACFVHSVQAEKSTTVTVVGISETFEDKASARDEAFRDAYRRAIEKGVGIHIKSETDMENLVVIMDVVKASAEGYVKNWKIDDEGTRPDGLYYLTMTAEVVKGEINKEDNDALRIVINLMGNPRFIVLIEETNLGNEPSFSTLEATLTESLTGYGYHSIDSEQKKLIHETEEFRKAKMGDTLAAINIATRMQADVVIIGKAYTEGLPKNDFFRGTNWVSSRAYSSVRAIIAETGEVLDINSPQCIDTGLTQWDAGVKAIKKCGNEIANNLIWNIPQHIGVKQEKTVQLVINGISYSEYLTLPAKLGKMRNVMYVFPKGWQKGGPALFDIKATGNANDLAKRLQAHNFQIVRSNMNKIEIQKLQEKSWWSW